jgi:hypothetical protein
LVRYRLSFVSLLCPAQCIVSCILCIRLFRKTQPTSQILFLPWPKLKSGICCHTWKNPSVNQIIVIACCSNVLNRTWSWHVTWHLECWMTSFYIYRASRVNHRTRFVSLSVSCDISLFFHSIQIFDPVKINLHHIQILKSSSQLHQLRKLSLLKNNGLMKMWKKMM